MHPVPSEMQDGSAHLAKDQMGDASWRLDPDTENRHMGVIFFSP
jgi:hypothetical protein